MKAAAAAVALGGLAACASLVSPSETTVQLRTTPEQAQCELKGRGGFAMSVATPAAVNLPSSATPVTVTCTAPGFRPTVNTLSATANGWIWGNSAFIVATGGVALLGAIVDESRGAGRSYRTDAAFDLDVDRPRPVKVVQRDGARQYDLQAR